MKVRSWLGPVLTAPDKLRLLYPQQQTLQRHVRFRVVGVRFTPESRRGSGRSRESEVEHPAGIWKREFEKGFGFFGQGSIQ